jgi:mono/diheme cytochrome c family protein
MRRSRRRAVTSVVPSAVTSALASVFLMSACSWFTDFKQQPKIDPWESAADSIAPRHNPQGSVPIYGSSAPGFAYDRSATIAAINAMAALPNPVAADERSLRNGAQQFAINCTPCHGPVGAGDGPVTKFGYPPMPIGAGSNAATTLSDGYLFGIIRNGRGLMPPYNRIEEQDRWDLINYLRALQSGAANLPTRVVGLPGQTGSLVPGPSLTAPTRPAPHYQTPSAAAPPSTATPAPGASSTTTPRPHTP